MPTLLPRPGSAPSSPVEEPDLPRLEPGDHLDRETFHRLYEATEEDCKAELIGGVVYMPSPLGRRHGRFTAILSAWLGSYGVATLGVESYDNATVLLGEESEPQPDLCLLISPARGGATKVVEDYISGAPELVVEVASSSVSYDLHSKKADYEKAGVQEYLVVLVREARVLWFIRREERFAPVDPGKDGVVRSERFPGLWLDPAALFRMDPRAVLDTLSQGLATSEHAAFVEALAGAGGEPEER